MAVQKPKAVEPEENIIIREARKQIDRLTQQRDTAVTNLNTTMQNAKIMEQQSFMLRGKIGAYDEQIEELRRRHGIKEKVS